MDYGITWKAALEEALSDMEGFELDDVPADHTSISAESDALYPGMEAANDLGSTDLGTSGVRSNESASSQARRSRAQTGERQGTFNTDKTKGPADKTTQDWVKEYEAKIKAIQMAKDKANIRLTKLVAATIRDNAEFMKTLKNSGRKPQETVSVTNWMYAHDPKRYLHQKIIRMKQVMDMNARAITDEANEDGIVLTMNKGDLEESIMRQIGAPSTIERYSQLMSWIQTQFRGRKAQVQLSSQDINKYVRQMEDFAKIEVQLKGDMGNVDRAINTLNAKARSEFSSSTIDAQEKGRIMQRMNRMGRVMAMYNNMVYMMYRLHVEYVLNRRAILKRLYVDSSGAENEKTSRNAGSSARIPQRIVEQNVGGNG